MYADTITPLKPVKVRPWGPGRGYTTVQAMNDKKILFVITKSGWGGAQAYVYALATAMAGKGAKVTVALGGAGLPGNATGLLASGLEAAGIEAIVIPSLVRDISLGQEWRAFKELRAIIGHLKPDALHLNSSKAAGLGALAGRLEGVKRIVFTVHGWPYREPGSYRRSVLIWLASLITVLLSHVTIVVSKADKKTVLGMLPQVKHIPLGLENFSMKTHCDARALLGNIPEEAYVIGTIAELTNNKGLEYGIRAFANLKQRGFADRYVILGDGELKEVLVHLARELGVADSVHFIGFVPDARSYLAAFDVFLLPSLKEGLPYALLEASIAGRPIVASDVGGIPEILERYGTGILVPPRRPNAIVQAVISLKKRGANAATPPTCYLLTEMIEETAALY